MEQSEDLSTCAGTEDQVVEFAPHLPPVSSEPQGQTGLSPVLKGPGLCGPLHFQPRYPHSPYPSIFLFAQVSGNGT